MKIFTTIASVIATMQCLAATTWYVAATGGNDSNDGKSSTTALKTIQKAVQKASNGDTILVSDGSYATVTLRDSRYQNDVYFQLTIKSVNGPFKTTIQGGEVRLGPNYNYSFNDKSSIEGFTIRGGSFSVHGGNVRRCIITAAVGSSILSCCKAFNSVFYGNTVNRSEFYATKLYNCTIYENHGDYIAYDSMGTTFYNCILYGNNKGRYVCSNWGNYAYNCCEKDPQCVSLENADFNLKQGSSCIDSGNNSYANGSYDVEGKVRIYNSKVDIGAFEYQPPQAEVKSVMARTRYPWNGKVDLKFTIEGESGVSYGTSFTAKDLVGNTNLTMKTLYKSNGAAANAAKEQLLPGTYNWVWDATADLGEGTVLERVVISISVQ